MLNRQSILGYRLRTKSFIFRIRNKIDAATLFAIWYRGIYGDLKIKGDDVVLDAGANIGGFSVYAAKHAGKVIAVEPEESNFRLLTENIVHNRIGNVLTVCCALSDFDGPGFIMGENVSAILAERTQGYKVDVKTVDSLLVSHGIDKVDIIKMDIEGAEIKVLKRSQFLAKAREIIVETHGSVSQRECEQILKLEGFNLRYVDAGRLLYQHIKKTSCFADYVVANIRTGHNDFRIYLDFVLAKMGVHNRSASVDYDLRLIYGYRNGNKA